MSKSSIWPINRTLSSATTLDQSGPWSNGIEEVLCIPQSSRTEASPSDCSMSYPGDLLGRSYFSAVMQSVYFTVPADWATYTTVVKAVHIYINYMTWSHVWPTFNKVYNFPILKSTHIVEDTKNWLHDPMCYWPFFLWMSYNDPIFVWLYVIVTKITFWRMILLNSFHLENKTVLV